MQSLANLTSAGQRCGFQRPEEKKGEETDKTISFNAR